MKKKISLIITFMLVCCLAMPANIQAAAVDVSGNEITEEQPAEDEQPAQEEQPAEDEQPTQEQQPAEDEQPAQEQQPAEDEQPAQEQQPAEEEQPAEEDTGEKGSLAVDGYYDDWEGVPETLITYGSHNTSGNVNEYHAGSMIVADEYVYVHVRMSDLYQQAIPVDELKLTINGVERTFIIRGRNEDNSINWDVSNLNLADGINNGYGVFYRDGGQISLGNAVLTSNSAKGGDNFEFRMSIAELEALYNLPAGTISNGAKLEFYSPNIGPEKITVVGTPTGAYLGIAICMVIALAAFLTFEKKRKQA